MIWGKNLDTKETTITLSASETERLHKRKPVTKRTASAQGEFILEVKLTKVRKDLRLTNL